MLMAYTNFTGGEISPSLAARYDLSKFRTSCRHLENFLPDLHGPLRRRMGTRFLENCDGPAVLVPFQFSADPDQNCVILLQDGRIRIARRSGYIRQEDGSPLELEAPYREAELYDISFAQSGDVVYLAHNGHALRKLQRFGHSDWRLSPVVFTPAIKAPATVTVAFSSGGGSYPLRYKVAAVAPTGETSAAALGKQPQGKHPSDWVVGDYATISWSAVEGAESYLVYREEAGVYGLIGVAEECEFRDDRYTADSKDTPIIPQDPFVEDNHPGLVCFHQQRLVLASPTLQPQTWHASRTGNYEDFSRSRPLKDDDAMEFTLASGRIDVIQWIVAFGDLLLGTAGGEYKAVGPDGVITPSSINVREQSYWGSARLRPLIIGNSVLHVQRQGSRVRDLCYSLEKDGYAGNDLSILAPHLVDGQRIVQWDYQQAPGSVILAVRDDGMLLALTYMREHEIWGWSRLTTRGRFRSVAVTAGQMEDDLYAVVERDIQGRTVWYLERFETRWEAGDGMAQAFYVDCGLSYQGEAVSRVSGLEHLEGEEVQVLADGAPLPPRTVRGGGIDLPAPASVIHAGLAYESLVCPQSMESENEHGASLSRQRSYGVCRMRLADSVGGSFGPSRDDMFDLPFIPARYGEAVEAFSGDREFSPDAGYSAEGEIWISQRLPLPFTLVALILDVRM